MSSTIIYHAFAILMPPALTGHHENLFLVAAQMGCSRTWEYGRGRNARRARDWQALHWGTEEAVLTEAIRTAGDLEGGGLKLDRASGWSRPETYIGRARKWIANAGDCDKSKGPVRFKGEHVSISLLGRTEKQGGSTDTEVIPWEDQRRVQGAIAASLNQNLRAYAFFKVYGPELRN